MHEQSFLAPEDGSIHMQSLRHCNCWLITAYVVGVVVQFNWRLLNTYVLVGIWRMGPSSLVLGDLN